MLNQKIALTRPLITHIQKARAARPITAAKLSVEIGKTTSYMSGVENFRIKTISSNDLISIFQHLHGIDSEEAIGRIEEILNSTQEMTATATDESLLDETSAIGTDAVIQKYTPIGDTSREEDYIKLLDIMRRAFMTFFEKEPEDAEKVVRRFISSMRFDLGFMMAILSIPFSALRPLSHKERQRAYDDISETFRKNFTIAQEKPKPVDE